jgi:cell division protease FtsH
LNQYLERQGWKVEATLSYRQPEPIIADVDTGQEKVNLLFDGLILISRENDRYAITVGIIKTTSFQIAGPENRKTEMNQFVDDVLAIADNENFYRGKNIEFNGAIRFLAIKNKSWDSVILDAKTKTEIQANTLGFLKQSERWTKYGIPLKRGVLLAGDPGTGKTIICRALMSEAKGITCITTDAYELNERGYIYYLYKLAQDLSPCIVFLEDIDSIGQDRIEFGVQQRPALLSLLSMMDGIEEQKNIVTVATTNCLEMLDKALSLRPSRFDRIIKLSNPSIEYRKEIIKRLCVQIPIDLASQDYIASQTDNCTPAYVQEIVFALAIGQPAEPTELQFSHKEIDEVISSVTHKAKSKMGFNSNGNCK